MEEIQTCEVCRRRFIAGYGYSLGVCWLVTGGANVAPFLCDAPGSQHWGCTPEHAVQATIRCLQNDGHMGAAKMRAMRGDKPRIAEEDRGRFNEANTDFHIVR